MHVQSWWCSARMQDDPEAIKGKLGDFLKENGVPYEFSTTTKFGRFRRRAKA
jgi:hypothetical protein